MSETQGRLIIKMTQETEVLKSENVFPVFRDLQKTVRRAAQEGVPVHEVEMAVWRIVLQIGKQALGQFFSLQGAGDMGETIQLPDGSSCQRLEDLYERRYISIFVEFELARGNPRAKWSHFLVENGPTPGGREYRKTPLVFEGLNPPPRGGGPGAA